MYKIALIDDDKDLLDLLYEYLTNKRSEFKIDKFENTSKAFNSLKKEDYDLILSDIIMPEMDGIELLKKLRKIKPNQIIILMTSYSTEEKMVLSDKLQVTDYITKPFISLRDVENKILDYLKI